MANDCKDFYAIYKSFLKSFEAYSNRYFSKRIKDSDKYPKLITNLYKELSDFTGGGKRIRAFLVYLGYLMGGEEDSLKILPISLSVEIIHSFLLIHDDIIDKSDIRRRKATIHKRYEKFFGSHYGISQAIVLGDIAGFEALKLVNSSGFSDRQKIECQKKLYDVILETAYGEALDIEYSYKKPKIGDIMQIADLKTARYSFVGPLSLGAILSKCSSGQLVAIREFGLLVGIAFQLQDDYLGIFGDEKILGKSVLSDMREGKNTLIIHKAKQLASSKGLEVINKIWGNPGSGSNELRKIREIVRKCGALTWCESENMRLTIVAKKEIARITKNHELQQILSQIADYVVSRQK
jgi:geranylgeranyl diphosphate synthase type I